jgi:hypothetical protein
MLVSVSYSQFRSFVFVFAKALDFVLLYLIRFVLLSILYNFHLDIRTCFFI